MQPAPSAPPAPPASAPSKSRFLQLLDETTAEELQGENPLDRASATLVTDHKRCDRYGYLRHRCGVRGPQKKAQDLGEQLHAQWRDYLRKGAAPTNPLAIGSLTYLPPPRAAGVVVERGFQFASSVERIDGTGLIQWFGYWDLYDGRTGVHEVTDHKTTSDFAKAPHELQKDPQMVLYAAGSWHVGDVMVCPDCRGTGSKWNWDKKAKEVCEACEGKGKLPPLLSLGVQPRDPASPIKVRHLYTLTKGKTSRPPKEVPFTFQAHELVQAYEGLTADLVHIRGVWQVPHWTQTKPTWSACDMFGGCPYRRFCDDAHASEEGGSDAAVAETYMMSALADFIPKTPLTDDEKEPDMTEVLEKSIQHVQQQKVAEQLATYKPPAARAAGVLPPDARQPPTVAPGQSGQLTLTGPAPGQNPTVDALNARVQRPAAPPPPAPVAPLQQAAAVVASPWEGMVLPDAMPKGRPMQVRVWGIERDAEMHDLGGGRWAAGALGDFKDVVVYGASEEEARGNLVRALCKRIPPPAPPGAAPAAAPAAAVPPPPAQPAHLRNMSFMNLALTCKEPPAPVTIRRADGTELEGVVGFRTDGMWEGRLVDGTERTASSREGLVLVLQAAPAGTKVGGPVEQPAAAPVTTETPAVGSPEKPKKERKDKKAKEAATAPAEAVTTVDPPAQEIAAVQTSPEMAEIVEVAASSQIFNVKIWKQKDGTWCVEHEGAPYKCRIPNRATRPQALDEITGYLSALVELAARTEEDKEEQKAAEVAVEEALQVVEPAPAEAVQVIVHGQPLPAFLQLTGDGRTWATWYTFPDGKEAARFNVDRAAALEGLTDELEKIIPPPAPVQTPATLGVEPPPPMHVEHRVVVVPVPAPAAPIETPAGFDLFIGCEPVKGYEGRARVLLDDYVEQLHVAIRAGKKVPDVRALNFSECRAVLAAMIHQNLPQGLVVARGHGELGALVLEFLRPYAARIVM